MEETFSTWEESLEDFEASYEEDAEEVEGTEGEVSEPSGEDDAPSDMVEVTDDADNIPDFPEEKQNQAFREMREKLQAAEEKAKQESQYADVIRRIAEQNGTTPEQIIEEYERRELQRQAEQDNVPVEYLQKQRELENQLKQIKSETFSENIRQQAEELKSEHDLTDEQVAEVARFMDEKGFPPSVSLSDGYFLMNKDKIIEEQVKEQQQQRLQNRKEKRRSAALPQGDASAPQSDNPNVLTDEEYESIKADLGLS